jgi:hypothetical protein
VFTEKSVFILVKGQLDTFVDETSDTLKMIRVTVSGYDVIDLIRIDPVLPYLGEHLIQAKIKTGIHQDKTFFANQIGITVVN